MYKIYKETLDLSLWISEIQTQNAVELPPEFHMYNKWRAWI